MRVRTVLQAAFTLEVAVADTVCGQVAQLRAAFERLGVLYVVALPYFVSARLTGTTPPESLVSDGWPLCQESLVDGERQYYFSNLPATAPVKEGRSYPGWNCHPVLTEMTFTFLKFERRRGTDFVPTFPEIRNLGPISSQFNLFTNEVS